MKRSSFAYPFAVIALTLFLAPLLLIAYYSLVHDGRITFEYYARFFSFSDPRYMKILWDSVKLAAISTIICLLIGYPMAKILASMKPRTRNILSLLFILPMWMNFLLRTYAWMTLLERNGLINTFLQKIGLPPLNLINTDGAIILGMVYNFLPFMILPIYNLLVKLDVSLLEAGEDLGASPFQKFWRVIFPLSLPGVMSGINMVFMPAVTTFVISTLLGGANSSTLIGDVIEYQFKYTSDWGFGSAMSIIIIILVLLFMAILTRGDKTERGVSL